MSLLKSWTDNGKTLKLSKLWMMLISVCLLAFLLGPIANLFSDHPMLKPISTDKQFVTISYRLQTSCSDCHTPGATAMPLYANLPIANGIIYRDIANAHAAFILSPQNLTGESPFSPLQLNKMQAVLRQNYMPPQRYLTLHWKAAISKTDKKALLDWLEKHDPNFN
jgi:cytochrome c peroxidase